MHNTTASEDRIIRDTENAIQGLLEITKRLDQELTDANTEIGKLNERVAELENDLKEAKS